MREPQRPRLLALPSEEEEPRPSPPPSSPYLDLGELAPRPRRRPLLPEGERARKDALARVLLLVGVSALAAIVIGPRLVGADVPGAEALGQPARVHVRADRDYALVDQVETELRRKEAREHSRAVWELDIARAQRDARVLAGALERVKAALASARGERATEPDEEPRELPEEMWASLEEVRAQVAAELALIGGEAPDDAAWRALVSALARAPDVGEELASAVREALSAPVVGDRALLALDEARGIVVRPVPPGIGRAERVMAAIDEVQDLEQARLALIAELRQRLRTTLPAFSEDDAGRIAAFAATLLRTTLTYNATESELRRQDAADSVPPELIRVRRGEMVLRPGQTIERRHLVVLEAMEAQRGDEMRTRAAVGTGAFVLFLCFVVYRFGLRGVFHRELSLKDLLLLGVLLVVSLLMLFGADRLVAPVVERWPHVPALALLCAVPTAFGAMNARLCLSADVALLFALLLALLGGVMAEPGTTWTVIALVSSMAGAAVAGRAERKGTLLLAGLAAGVAGSAAAITLEAFRSALDTTQLLWLGGAALVGGLASGALAVATTPLVEGSFGYVTPLRLRALTDLNQPLLKDLIVHAPGTWHHSMRVAHLVEGAAHAIGANRALARAMALYHDVGKIKQPQYFLENVQGRENPHDKLSPEQSAAILLDHVRHGVELARKHRIPRIVAASIVEHHGDNRMEFFLQRARAELMHRENAPLSAEQEEALDAAYRYGGALPRTRESALVLLADQIEAATRALESPTDEELRTIVDGVVDRALIDDALVRCDLSLRDLGSVRHAFWRALSELETSRTAHPEKRQASELELSDRLEEALP